MLIARTTAGGENHQIENSAIIASKMSMNIGYLQDSFPTTGA
jgi:hypothetical protein